MRAAALVVALALVACDHTTHISLTLTAPEPAPVLPAQPTSAPIPVAEAPGAPVVTVTVTEEPQADTIGATDVNDSTGIADSGDAPPREPLPPIPVCEKPGKGSGNGNGKGQGDTHACK